MDYFKPQRRICPEKKVRFEISAMNPFEWIRLNNSNYVFNEIDGYIINEKGVNGVFIKYESKKQTDISSKHALELINQNLAALKLADLLKCPFRIMIWPEDYPNDYDIESKLICSIDNNGITKKINFKQLEDGIKVLRGFSFSNAKNLLTASSFVECYLANNTGNPWPGDLDGLLFDKQSNLFTALIEFKTHNIDSPTNNEYIGKYSEQDWRRFDVLFKIQDEIEKHQGLRPKLFYIVWGTKEIENHKYIKIDTLDNKKIVSTELIERPPFDIFSDTLFNMIKA